MRKQTLTSSITTDEIATSCHSSDDDEASLLCVVKATVMCIVCAHFETTMCAAAMSCDAHKAFCAETVVVPKRSSDDATADEFIATVSVTKSPGKIYTDPSDRSSVVCIVTHNDDAASPGKFTT